MSDGVIYGLGSKYVDQRIYNAMFGVLVFFGAVINWVCAENVSLFIQFTAGWSLVMYVLMFGGAILFGVIMPIVTYYNFWMRLIGYFMVVTSVGILLNMILAGFTLISLSSIFVCIATVAIVITLYSIINPQNIISEEATVKFIFVTVVITEVVFSAMQIVPVNVLDYIITFFVCQWVGYNWMKSPEEIKILDDAIQNALNVSVVSSVIDRLILLFK